MQNWIKEKSREVQYAVTRKSPAQKAFLEATNDEKWGPSSSQMLEVANYANSYKEWDEIKTLFFGLFQNEGKKHVRMLKKGLLLLEYLITNGSANMRNESRMFMGDIQSFVYLQSGATGEQGAVEAVIRKKAQDILNLINDNELYQMEREKAQKLKNSLTSVTNDGFGSSYESSTYGHFGHGIANEKAPSFSPYGNERASSFNPYNDPYASKGNDNEYYSDDEGMPTPSAPARQAPVNPLARPPPQSGFNPFQSPSAAVPDEENPYQKRQTSTEVFNPFAQHKAQAVSRPSSSLDDLLGGFGSSNPAPAPAAAPSVDLLFGSPQPAPVAQPSGGANLMFGNQQPVQRPAAGANLMFGNQQPRAQPQMNPFGGQPAAPQPAAQFDDFLNLSGPAPAQPMGMQQPKPQGGAGMLSEFGDLVNLNFNQQQERIYGRAGFQQRGSGPTLGGRPF